MHLPENQIQNPHSRHFRRPYFVSCVMVRVSIMALASTFLLTQSPTQADQNWDGDNPIGNFSLNSNWFGNNQPGWGFGNGSLYFNFRNNGSQTSLYYDLGWQDTNDIIWDTTFGAGLTWNGSGNGLNFNQRLENRSSFTQTVGSMNLSGAKNGASRIELNPVNGNLILNGNIFNDNSKPYYVYGNNGKTLTLNTPLGVGGTAGTVSFNIADNNNVIFGADQTYAGGTVISAGSLQVGAGGTVGTLGSGTVTNNSSLIFNRSNALAVSNTINGSGSVSQTGGGTTTFSGTSNGYTGTTTISAGGLGIYADTSLGAVPGSAANKILFTGSGSLIDSANNITLHANRGISISSGATATFDSNGNDFDINGNISGSGGNVSIKGAGKVTISGTSSYTGTTSLLSGGTLLVGANTALASGSAMTLSGGKLNVNGKTVSTGALNLTQASVLDLSGTSKATFSNAANSSWSGVLSIWNWSGNFGGNGAEQLIFTTNNLTSPNLASVNFYSDSGTTLINGGGGALITVAGGSELVPVPEPGALISGLLLLGVLGFRERRTWLHYRVQA